MRELIDKLYEERDLSTEEFMTLFRGGCREEISGYLFEKAREVQQAVYGKKIFIRGLIEFTNFCKNDCYYCGIRRSNRNAARYRLTKEEILQCCRTGYDLGFRTFVLQGGEDGYFSREKILELIQAIKVRYPDCALTLSIGEWDRKSYEEFYNAGADRYLLRHETADRYHYQQLHPKLMSWENRMRCLRDLKEIGYQTGAGFMVGSPGQKTEHLIKELKFLKELNPQMIGIGPFIPHKDTPFNSESAGNLEMTLFLLSVIRLMMPKVLLPATTALGTIADTGREQGILAGANVVMPNLSPRAVRKKYLLYDDKICTGDEAAEGLAHLRERLQNIGYEIVVSRGDFRWED